VIERRIRVDRKTLLDRRSRTAEASNEESGPSAVQGVVQTEQVPELAEASSASLEAHATSD
jgi:hypothetical protein